MDRSSGQKNLILWMDLEMTGLDPKTDTIIEIASLVTNNALEILDEGPELVIHTDPERFDKMDQWNREHHSRSGLWKKVVESRTTLKDAEEATLKFIQKHFKVNEGQLTGNSIWQDRRFLIDYMPRIDQYLHYRMIDISTVKSLYHRWYRGDGFKKKGSHRALDDIKESVEELRFYRDYIFKKN